jgi:(1->4)-alpha-D-glucan 1-alpha-D-glucosylmutase
MPATPRHRPRPRAATYRVQFNAGFTFDDAAGIAGYLAGLGVSHLYCSPCLQAAAGSTHGYDVVDHSRLNAELGGAPAHARMTGQLAAHGLGQVLDIVPNHMALAGRANAWWWDVLENGPSSPYARYFDIDWDPPQHKLAATVLMPVLGDQYGRVLEAGELTVERRGGAFTVRYHEHEAPLSPRALDGLLARAAARADSSELGNLAAGFGRLPLATRTDAAAVAERHRDKELLRDRLAALCGSRPAVAAAIDAEIGVLNRDPDALDELLSQQNYRLAYWRTAAEELSYRRFFDIPTLAGVRVEDDVVFADTHRLILGLVADGTVDGLRVDHVDGLADPEGYLERLHAATGGAYVVVEKILAAGEELPESWLAAGTTGYDFLRAVGRLFVGPGNEAAIAAGYARFTGQDASYAEIVRAAKLQVMRDDLAAELERLTSLLADVCEGHRRQRDHTRRELRDAAAEMIAAFGVYRIYPRPARPGRPGQAAQPADRAQVAAAVATVRRRRPDIDGELASFIGELLTGGHPGAAESEFAVRFAQLTPPVMAKGVEDTAFYRYQPLISLNEVGGGPRPPGAAGQGSDPVADFHRAMARAARRWPQAMLTLSTHDTKRSGDVRARISLLAELPDAWERTVARWARRNERHKQHGWPDRNAEYLLYQTLVGAWPIGAARAGAFMAKAAREAKVHTSWTEPSARYEEALGAFVSAVLADRGFTADLTVFLAEHQIIELGRVSSLAQTTLLLTCPGVPDLYQGTEVWDLSLVDPDNRRPVDYAARRRLLAALGGAGPEEVLRRADEGGPKLWLIHRLLLHRRRQPGPYGPDSGYEPLRVTGSRASHAVAFTRGGGLAVVVPRQVTGLADGWGDTTVALPDGAWTDVLTGTGHGGGGEASLAGLLGRFPVTVLARDEPPGHGRLAGGAAGGAAGAGDTAPAGEA